MSAETGDDRALPALLAALAVPAVLVDRGGLVAAWNGAAEVRFGLSPDGCGQPIASLVGPLAATGHSVALTDDGASLVVWSLDDDGLGPDDLALQKADALGRVAGGIKHDISNKFLAITTLSEMIQADRSVPADLRETSGELASAARQALGLTHATLEYARHATYGPRLIALGPIVRETVELLKFATMNIETRVHVPDSLPQIEADATLMRQALLALVVHALEAQGVTWFHHVSQPIGRLYLSGSVRDDGLGPRVRLAIEDGAEVLPEAQRATILAGSGGPRATRDLAVARSIILRAGGRLSYEPVANGNRIVVELPIAGTTLPQVVPARPPRETLSGDTRPLVLVCDDEQLIRGLLVRFLERVGIAVVEARDGREALAAIASKPIRMVIADQQMPDLSGTELFDMIVARRPELATRFILTSGDPGRADIAEFTARTGVQVLAKPFDHDRLVRQIQDAVAD